MLFRLERRFCVNCRDLGKKIELIIIFFLEFLDRVIEIFICFVLILIMSIENSFEKNISNIDKNYNNNNGCCCY